MKYHSTIYMKIYSTAAKYLVLKLTFCNIMGYIVTLLVRK